MPSIEGLVDEFVRSVSFTEGKTHHGADVYNEFSLQHELGAFLRRKLTGDKVQFERSAYSFPEFIGPFAKKEIDISVFSADLNDLRCAIEVKFPRNGQHPETLFSFCRDISFAEQLKKAGFSIAAAVIVADDPLFYQGRAEGIYAPFRSSGALPVAGQIIKPTGKRDTSVEIVGSYHIHWKPIVGEYKYAIVEVD